MKVTYLSFFFSSALVLLAAAAGPRATFAATPAAGSTVTLQNTHSKLCVGNAGSTGFAYLKQATCVGATSQQFTLQAAPTSGWYYVTSVSSKYCWDVTGSYGSVGALVRQYTCTPARAEYFQLKAVSGGYELLDGAMANGCIDVENASLSSGARLEQNTCTGVANQIFTASVVGSGNGSGSGTGSTTHLLTASPTSLSFASVNIGSTGSSHVTLTNTGNSNVTISSVTPSGSGFTTSGVSANTTLTPGQSLTLNVTFAPTTSGSVTGSVAVASNATNSPASIALSGTGATTSIGGTTVNVKNYGATGNGSTDDTSAINSAISALSGGATLLFPCGTYLTSSQLSLNLSNVTVDGSSCAVIHNTSSGTVFSVGGSGNGNPNYGSAVSLSSTANELATSFSTTSSLGVAAGDYVLLQQGGKDSSDGSGDSACDPSGCRGELLKVASASGNSITVTTALHDTYNPSVNAATAQKIISPLTGITIRNITFDGNGSNTYGLAIAGVADSSISGVTARNVQGSALLNRGDFNVSWSNVTVTGAGSAQCGSSAWFENQGNLSINGLAISSENQGASGSGCLDNGAFGFELIASANSAVSNLSVDASGAYGRPFKTIAARYNTFNSPVVKNGAQAYNGISLEYYSSHNTYNSCTVTNNGAGTGTGTGNAGIITFGNFNQYNSFNNCTVSGNGNVQFYISGYDALSLAADSHNTISGGTFTGENTVEAAILIEGDGTYITGATIRGPGAQGLYLDTQASNACVNNNTFVGGTSLGSAISVNASNDMGAGNLLNLLGSDLSAGSCTASLP